MSIPDGQYILLVCSLSGLLVDTLNPVIKHLGRGNQPRNLFGFLHASQARYLV